MASFKSADEFREVMDRTLELMSGDPEMGPRLREADTPQRWEFPDVDLVVNIAPSADGDSKHNLTWEWSDDVAWQASVVMQMSSDVANRYFQGAENIAMAVARRHIKPSGDYKAALALVPVTKPVFPMYRQLIASEYPHLLVQRD
jgi:hypothetical protein